MNRRTIAVALAAAILLFSGRISEAADNPSPRLKLSFNADWKFIRQDLPAAKDPAFDDSTWTTISCPHTYNDSDTFDDLSPGGHIGEITQWQGRTWYRKHFKTDPTWRDKKVFIEFEAARQVAEVYLNGRLLGTCESGFTPFGFDLTPQLLADGAGENVLAVMCDNSFESHGEKWQKAEIHGFPWNDPHWHPAHGGLYRNVYLHVTAPVHVTLPLYSDLQTEGTYAYAQNVTADSADVGVEAEVQNETDEPKAVQCVSEVMDRQDKIVLNLSDAGPVPAGGKRKFVASGKLAKPQRWEPGYPYLYTVVTMLKVGGKMIDRVETPLGVRSAKFTLDRGFFINDHHLKLHGWGQKPTDEWPGLGAALPDWLHDYTLKMMKDAGGNYLRWGHCAGPPVGVSSADKYGIITTQPGVDGESDATGHAWDVRTETFRDVLIYFRNHPSILLWEGGNQSVTEDHVKQLKDLKLRWDPHGGRGYMHRRSNATVCKYLDVTEGTEGSHECLELPVVEGEYDREESPRRVWDDFSPPNFGYPEARGMTYDLTSEQFAVNQAAQWEKIAAPSHCGGAKWIFSDTSSGGRLTCEVARVSGNVDAVRLPKEAYYAIMAIFRDDPQVQVLGHWTYPPNTTKPVYVMSNCDEVELRVNGKSLGKGAKSHGYVFTFPSVHFEPGTIQAIGYDDGQPAARQEKKTAGQPRRVKLTAITGPRGWRADGSDVALIDAEVVDAAGNRCPTFQQRIDFTTTGPAVWRGGYNSGKAHSTNNTYLDLECGINRVSLRSTTTAGTVRVEGKVAGLEPGSIELASQPVEIRDGMSPELPAVPAQGSLTQPSPPRERRVIISGGEKPQPASGKLITAFSYSGPSKGCTVQPFTGNEFKAFCDRTTKLRDLPAEITAGEFVQAPCDDKTYSALDLMQFTAGADVDVYIAHDDRVARPAWLTADFKDTGQKVSIGNAKATLFKRTVAKNTGLTLGGNQGEPVNKSCVMYVVIAAPRAAKE